MRQRTAIASVDDHQPVYPTGIPRSHDHISKVSHRSRIYSGVSTRANEGGAMTSVTQSDGMFSQSERFPEDSAEEE